MSELSLKEIGRFQIKNHVGQGGMGVVYRGYDPVLKRDVAIKLLAPYLGSDPQAKARFQREASLIAGLKHSHIAGVYEFGEHEGRPYIAMEWVKGRTLKQLLHEDDALPTERALGLFRQLTDALEYSHRKGVIHRDLKPSNILINDNDEVTVVDFGLAWIADAPSITATGSVVGTPLYMSPEQIQGKNIDERSDLYSLAIVLYEMLSGVTPFYNDSTPALYHQQLFAPPPPITEQNPTVPVVLEQALTRALSKVPDERFESVAEFRGAVIRPNAPIVASPALPAVRTARWRWRNALIAVAVGVLAATVLFALSGLLEEVAPQQGAYWGGANGTAAQTRFSAWDHEDFGRNWGYEIDSPPTPFHPLLARGGSLSPMKMF